MSAHAAAVNPRPRRRVTVPDDVLAELRPPGGWHPPTPTLPARPATRRLSSRLLAGVDVAVLARQVADHRVGRQTRSGRRNTWREQAACRGIDPNLFHPRRGEDTAPAKAVCEDCPVRRECLVYALATVEKHGIWGGLSERERRPLRSAIARHLRREAGAA